MRKHQVTFYSPGSFVSEQSTRDISEWDPAIAAKLAHTIVERHGAKPYGFRFQTILAHEPIEDGEGGTLAVYPKMVEESGLYHLNSELRFFHQIAADDDPNERILLSNMRCNGWWIVAENRNSWRSVLPFEERDFVVNEDGTILHAGDDPIYTTYRATQEEERQRQYRDGTLG